MDFHRTNFERIISGTTKLCGIPGIEYGWTKVVLALYWAAFARNHPDLFVVIVSPGSVSITSLLSKLGCNPFSVESCSFGGTHEESAAAKRYIDALLGEEDPSQVSGSFWALRKGYDKNFGDVTILKTGLFVRDVLLQDKAWATITNLFHKQIS